MCKCNNILIYLLTSFVCLAYAMQGYAYETDKQLSTETVVIKSEKKEKNNSGKSNGKKGKDNRDVDKANKNEKTKAHNKKIKGNDRSKELVIVIKELKDSIMCKDNQIRSQQIEIDSLTRDLDELLAFRIELLNNLCKEIDKMEALPYPSMSLLKIDSIEMKIRPFLSAAPNLAKNENRLLELKDKKIAFDRFRSAVKTMPYGDELKCEYSDFRSAFSSGSPASQQAEILELEKCMEVYVTLIHEFCNVIEEFKLQLEYARNNNDMVEAKDMARVTFKMNDDFKSAKGKMSQNPYMASLLDEYLGLLSTNPLDEKIVEIEGVVALMAESLPKAESK